MGDQPRTIRLATIQAAPVFLDREATVAKAVSLISEAASEGAELILLPESFVPGYPVWLWSSNDGGNPGLEEDAFARLFANAVEVPSDSTRSLGQAARDANAVVAIGVTERESEYGHGTLYNTLLVFDQDGRLILRHRKLMPTYKERTVWGQGDGSSLAVCETSLGRIGGLICWENLMPLARYALYAQGEQVHLAPTAAIVAPGGDCDYLAGPLFNEEGILRADLDLGAVARAKHSFDVAGHYARPDVFELHVSRAARRPVIVEDRLG